MTGIPSWRSVLEVHGISHSALQSHPLPEPVSEPTTPSQDRITLTKADCYRTNASPTCSLSETDGTSSSCSWGDDELERETALKVQQMYDDLESVLYENKSPERIGDELCKECQDWSRKFPYLRLTGQQIAPLPENNDDNDFPVIYDHPADLSNYDSHSGNSADEHDSGIQQTQSSTPLLVRPLVPSFFEEVKEMVLQLLVDLLLPEALTWLKAAEGYMIIDQTESSNFQDFDTPEPVSWKQPTPDVESLNDLLTVSSKVLQSRRDYRFSNKHGVSTRPGSSMVTSFQMPVASASSSNQFSTCLTLQPLAIETRPASSRVNSLSQHAGRVGSTSSTHRGCKEVNGLPLPKIVPSRPSTASQLNPEKICLDSSRRSLDKIRNDAVTSLPPLSCPSSQPKQAARPPFARHSARVLEKGGNSSMPQIICSSESRPNTSRISKGRNREQSPSGKNNSSPFCLSPVMSASPSPHHLTSQPVTSFVKSKDPFILSTSIDHKTHMFPLETSVSLEPCITPLGTIKEVSSQVQNAKTVSGCRRQGKLPGTKKNGRR